MIRRSTWITLGVFVILLFFAIYWTSFRPVDTALEITPTPEPPWSFTQSEIEGLEIINNEQDRTIRLSKSSKGNWMQNSPDEGQVDASTVEQAIGWLNSPMVRRVLTTEGGLAQFGFDEPRGIIKVFLYGGETMQIFVGENAPTGNQTYVMVPNTDNVLLINNLDVDSILDLVGIELLLPPLPEEIETELEPEVP